MMRSLPKIAAIALVTAMAAPLTAEAHRFWMLPSATVLSGDESWITVDAAISNDLFFFNHHGMPLDGVTVTAPDGSTLKKQHAGEGEYRSTFDVHLTQEGTHRLAMASDFIFARYMLDGEEKRWRGAADAFPAALPDGASDITATEAQRRVETFVTLGLPTDTVLKPTGRGLELVPVTHPNDLFAGETATFQFLLDGEPAPAVDVTLIPDGTRYRTSVDDISAKTNENGRVEITWPQAGRYWLNAAVEDEKTSTPAAKRRQAEYTATLEVLPQ